MLRGLVPVLLLGMFVLFAILAAWWREQKERRLRVSELAAPQPVESATVGWPQSEDTRTPRHG